MKFTLSILSVVLAACQLAATAPAEHVDAASNNDAASAAAGTVWLFRDRNFQGPFINVGFNSGDCVTVPPGWQNSVSSIRLLGSLDTCRFYADAVCQSPTRVVVRFPGIGNLGVNDRRLNSFTCYTI